MDTNTNIMDIIGYYGPTILILANLWYLRYRIFHMFLFMLYIALLILTTKQLKLWIKDPRPYGYNHVINDEWMNAFHYDGAEMYGMPSGHSTLVFFSLFYLIFETGRNKISGNKLEILLGFFVAALTLYQRYAYKKHTILQLIVGAILGVVFAYIAYNGSISWLSKA